jgi:hypothetical protein
MRSGTISQIFPKLVFFAGFSLDIIKIARRISNAAMGRAGTAQRLVLLVKELKTTGALSARAHKVKKKGLYHRERILETSTLSCNEEEEEITKPPTR